MRPAQRGASFVGLLLIGVALVMAGTIGLQLVPIYMEKTSVQRAVNQSAQLASVIEVRSQFDRAAQVDGIESIAGKDLVVGKEAGRLVVSYAYSREIHLVGPAYLVLKFTGRSP
jgi:hypothetical protein